MKKNLHALRSIIVAFIFTPLLFTACKKGHPCDTDQPAKGSLQDMEGNCLPGVAHGSWIAGLTSKADSSYVDVTVKVTSPGSYHIVSDSSNGVQFADSGVFTQTGNQTVRLKPKGIFTAPKLTIFNISFDNSSCGFYVRVDSLPPLTSNRWRFTANGTLYQGHADSHMWFLPNHLGTILEFNQEVFNSPDTLLVFEMVIPSDVPDMTVGTYPSSWFYVTVGPDLILDGMHYSDERANIIVTLHGAIFPPPEHTRQIIGTFEGTAVDPRTDEVIQVTNGEFHMGT
jgi:hypothetical protein